jgi:DNA repair exonuclease SbcCD nuclease subunit
MRILAIGDPHFKVDNIEESKVFITNLSSYLSQNTDIEIIVVLGDVLHNHEKLHTFALNSAIEFFTMLVSHKRKCFCLVGNHDATSNTIFLTDNHWMNALKGWDGLTIVDHPVIEFIGESFITLCPYVPDGRFLEALSHLVTVEETRKVKRYLKDDKDMTYSRIKIHDWKESKCIFSHQLFDGVKMGAIVAKNVEEWKPEYPFCINGHIHENQRPQENLYIPGSAMQEGYGDMTDKIVAVITITDDKYPLIEEVDLNIKRKKIIYTTIDEIDTIKEKLEKNENIDYKIVVKGSDSELKALKNSSKYKDTLDIDNVKKITFKTTWKEDDRVKILEDDFIDCLQTLIYNEEDPYLSSLYEHVVYGKEDKSDKDVFFFSSDN